MLPRKCSACDNEAIENQALCERCFFLEKHIPVYIRSEHGRQ